MNRLYYPGTGCWISDQWQFNGMRTLIMENELLRIVILIDKGTDIVEFRYKPKDIDFLLHLPQGIRNPAHDVPSGHTGSAFLDYFSGGWNEVLPNGGPLVNYRGAALGQHGEVSLVPWNYAILQESPDQIVVRFRVDAVRTPLSVEKTLTLNAGEAKLYIDEMLSNRAGETVHCMWGQHIAFGRPFLDEGAVIDVPPCKFIVHDVMDGYDPRRFKPQAESPIDKVPVAEDAAMTVDARLIPPYGAVQAQEMAYLAELQDGWYAISNLKREVGFGVRFDHSLFKYVWYWQQLGNVASGYPWWGNLHCMALEPWTSYPTNGLNEAVANGTALELQPKEAISHRMIATAFTTDRRVHHIDRDGAKTLV